VSEAPQLPQNPQVPQDNQGKGTRPELRIVFATVLSLLVIFGWMKVFGPKPTDQPPQGNKPAATTPATSGTQPRANASSGGTTPTSVAPAPAPAAAPVAAKGDSQERTIVVESDLYRIEFSNRGGVVKSWKLKKYTDDSKPPRVLDVVHAKDS